MWGNKHKCHITVGDSGGEWLDDSYLGVLIWTDDTVGEYETSLAMWLEARNNLYVHVVSVMLFYINAINIFLFDLPALC